MQFGTTAWKIKERLMHQVCELNKEGFHVQETAELCFIVEHEALELETKFLKFFFKSRTLDIALVKQFKQKTLHSIRLLEKILARKDFKYSDLTYRVRLWHNLDSSLVKLKLLAHRTDVLIAVLEKTEENPKKKIS